MLVSLSVQITGYICNRLVQMLLVRLACYLDVDEYEIH